jgi:hypothetical protein
VEHLNIIKLCVGAESVEDLEAWHAQNRSRWPAGRTEHITRMWPRREAEVLGGSLYWVIKGLVQARQRIVGLERRTGSDGIERCALVLDARVIRTDLAPRRPFQGWRYLPADQSPPDLPQGREREDALPPGLAQALAEIGLR